MTATTADYSEVEIERDTKGRNMQGQVAENRSISLGSETQLDSWLVETKPGLLLCSGANTRPGQRHLGGRVRKR